MIIIEAYGQAKGMIEIHQHETNGKITKIIICKVVICTQAKGGMFKLSLHC